MHTSAFRGQVKEVESEDGQDGDGDQVLEHLLSLCKVSGKMMNR